MPALRPVPAVARVTCRGTANGQAIVNVFHVKWTGGNFDLPAITYVANLVKGAYEANFAPRLGSTWAGDTVRAVDLSLTAGQEATVALAGTSAGSAVQTPQSAACCVTWRIMRHYRGGHPRTYLGPLATTAIQNPTTLADAYVTQVITSANAFLSAINLGSTSGNTMRLVAVHRTQDQAELIVPQTSDIISATADTRIDTMRRRLGRDR